MPTHATWCWHDARYSSKAGRKATIRPQNAAEMLYKVVATSTQSVPSTKSMSGWNSCTKSAKLLPNHVWQFPTKQSWQFSEPLLKIHLNFQVLTSKNPASFSLQSCSSTEDSRQLITLELQHFWDWSMYHTNQQASTQLRSNRNSIPKALQDIVCIF